MTSPDDNRGTDNRDISYPAEDVSLREVATRIGIPLVALVALAVFTGVNPLHDPRHSVLIGLVFLAAFSTLVILMRFEMGRRRFWLVGGLVAIAALLVRLL